MVGKHLPAAACVLLFLCSLLGFGEACSTDEDCNLNGVCSNGGCMCDPGWIGTNCTNISFALAPPVGAFGYSPNVTAWGGIPVLVNGTYHLLVAEMVDGCGLCTWGTNSRVAHATSDTLLGPYTFEDVALPVWSHNPHIVVDYSSGSPVYLLFHIGSADGGVTPKVCNASLGEEWDEKKSFDSQDSSGVLHTATDPAGPWTPQNPPGLGGCNNPAPYVFPNGSIHLVCSQGGQNVFTADSWKGPWTGSSITWSGNPGAGIWEDPFIWLDQRGHWKMLAHVYPQQGTAEHFWDRVSGFAYSYDGFSWVQQPFQPYTNVVNHTNGAVGYTTRERPKIFFDPKDRVTPLALFNGVAEGENCWDCKQTCGVDWTFNIAVPINS